MTTEEYRNKLIEQFNKTQIILEQLRGAIAACDEPISTEDDDLVPPDEEESNV